MLLKHSGQGNVVTQFCQTNLHLTLRRRIKDNLSEMPGFLSGGLPFESVVKRACLVLGLGKMFHPDMFADFDWRNVPETV